MSTPRPPEFKLQLVPEALQSDEPDAAIARKHGVAPSTLAHWKKTLLDEGHRVYEKNAYTRRYETRIAQLEEELDRKTVELALFENFADAP